jgi:hypothetical protein
MHAVLNLDNQQQVKEGSMSCQNVLGTTGYILGLYSQQIEMQCRLVLKLAKVDDISQSTLVLKEF